MTIFWLAHATQAEISTNVRILWTLATHATTLPTLFITRLYTESLPNPLFHKGE